jgi:hypothetical protein
MADKYRDKAPGPGRCERVDDVHIRLASNNVRHRAGRKSHTLVEMGSTQVPCPKNQLERCGGCIVDIVGAEIRHPEWSAIAGSEGV